MDEKQRIEKAIDYFAEVIVRVSDWYKKNLNGLSKHGCPYREEIGHFVECKDKCSDCWKDFIKQGLFGVSGEKQSLCIDGEKEGQIEYLLKEYLSGNFLAGLCLQSQFSQTSFTDIKERLNGLKNEMIDIQKIKSKITYQNAADYFRDFLASQDDDFHLPTTTSYELAIEALEKQIPRIPDLEGDGYADGELVYDTWICPNCGKHYEVDFDDYKFCPECGQAIAWEEEM